MGRIHGLGAKLSLFPTYPSLLPRRLRSDALLGRPFSSPLVVPPALTLAACIVRKSHHFALPPRASSNIDGIDTFTIFNLFLPFDIVSGGGSPIFFFFQGEKKGGGKETAPPL